MSWTINGETLDYRKLVTIDGSKVSTETGIPLGININLPDVKAGGADVRLAHTNDNPIAREIECVDVPNTDDVMIWYPFNTTADQDDQFYVYWGNAALSEPAADSTYGSEAVWDSVYQLVQLMNNDPNGDTADCMKDSTSNDRHMTPYGSMTTADLVDAAYGKGIDFDGSNDRLSRASGNPGVGNAWTVIARATFDTDTHQGVFGLAPSSGRANEVRFYRQAANDKLYGANRNSADTGYIKNYGSAGSIALATTYILGLTWDGTDLHIYIDGSQSTPYSKDTDNAGTMTNTNRLIHIGWDQIGSLEHNGIIEFVGMTNDAKDSDYMLTVHNNQNNPTASGTSPFYSSMVSVSTGLLDGKIRIKDVKTVLADGLVKVKDVATGLLDGEVAVKDEATGGVYGKVRIKDELINLADGMVKIIERVTSVVDGKVRIKDISTALADGKVRIKDIATSLLDGKVRISDFGIGGVDGKVRIKDVITSLADGKIKVFEKVTNIVDGKVKIIEKVINLADGKVRIKDKATNLFDGLIRLKDEVTGGVDGKVNIKDVISVLADGKVKIKDVATSLLDGKINIKDVKTSLADGKIRIVNVATSLADGKVYIIKKLTNLLDGLLQIPARYTIITSSEQQHDIVPSSEVLYNIEPSSTLQHTISIINDEVYYTIITSDEQQHNIVIIEDEE